MDRFADYLMFCTIGYSLVRKGSPITMIPRIVPLILASLLLAAHFLRASNWPLVLVSLLVPLLLLVRKQWSLNALELLTCIGAGIWLYTGIGLVEQRLAAGAPWVRLALIMAAVAAFTLWAARLLNSEAVRKKFESE